ncbi:hypothetical protein QOZ80_4BG0351700 [Eleusine coracana subsp. coracana]|nr:hypothetical protein QOZ80_4BG0351700 [Eleusine coracana subsp. coracana]
MFDKVVTPSDVGKLNRLVIPKQHAEKYFPLDSAANEKGLLLSFEDRAGKLWRFRYSYWNSSQSYVMTKGWSRLVKEKRLDAGDTVSFFRGAGEAARGRLFIDWKWKRRHDLRHRLPPGPLLLPPLHGSSMLPPRPPPMRMTVQSNPTVPLVNSPTAAAKRVRLFGVYLHNSQSGGGELSLSHDNNALRRPEWQRMPTDSSSTITESSSTITEEDSFNPGHHEYFNRWANVS